MPRSYYPMSASTGMVWAPPRSLATTCGITFVFSSCGYLDVSVPRVRLQTCWICNLQLHGLPHSETPGSKIICIYPELIAAYRVLLRLREPRHPPCALLCFLSLMIRSSTGSALVNCISSLALSSHSICQRSFSRENPDSMNARLPRREIIFKHLLPSRNRTAVRLVENKGLEPLTLCVQGRCSKPTELIPRTVVPGRLELPTSTLSVWRSNQLSYRTG